MRQVGLNEVKPIINIPLYVARMETYRDICV